METMIARVFSLSCGALLLSSACTFVTGAGDYKADAEREQEEIDKILMSQQRNLDFSFAKMSAHANFPLDVAVVNEADFLVGRARIIVPAQPAEGDFPDIELPMSKTLLPGAHRLFFYVDNNSDYMPFPSAPQNEHIWVVPVDPDGGGTFTHSFMFTSFDDNSFMNVGADIILDMPELPGSEVMRNALLTCIGKQIGRGLKHSLEVKVFFDEEDRQVGYFAMFKGSPPPDGNLRLEGIADAGSRYRFEVLVDGSGKNFTAIANMNGEDLHIPFAKWFPNLMFDVAACKKLIGM